MFSRPATNKGVSAYSATKKTAKQPRKGNPFFFYLCLQLRSVLVMVSRFKMFSNLSELLYLLFLPQKLLVTAQTLYRKQITVLRF